MVRDRATRPQESPTAGRGRQTAPVTTFVLVHGAGGTGGFWHLVAPLLRAAGHGVAAPDLPNSPGATFANQAEAVVAAAAGADDVVLVGQSMGAYPAALACARLPVRRLVLLNAMVPRPGESAGDWWDAVGQASARARERPPTGPRPEPGIVDEVHLLHDVTPEVLALLGGASGPADSLFAAPFPVDGWPDVPITVLVGREDRLFPPSLQRRVARERLGQEVVDAGRPPGRAQPARAGGRRAARGRGAQACGETSSASAAFASRGGRALGGRGVHVDVLLAGELHDRVHDLVGDRAQDEPVLAHPGCSGRSRAACRTSRSG